MLPTTNKPDKNKTNHQAFSVYSYNLIAPAPLLKKNAFLLKIYRLSALTDSRLSIFQFYA